MADLTEAHMRDKDDPDEEPDDPDDWGDPDWGEPDWGDDEAGDEWGHVFTEADDYVRVPKGGRRGRRWLIVGLVVFGLLTLAGIGAAAWINSQVNPSGGPGELIEVEVSGGATVGSLATDLEEAGIITNALVFRGYSRQQGFSEVQAGRYELSLNSSMGDVIVVLEAGPSAPPAAAQVTLPEGLRLDEVVPRVTDALSSYDPAELQAAIDAAPTPKYRPADVTSLEGFLFPDTYRIEAGDEEDEAKLIRQMIEQFNLVTTELGYDAAAERTSLSAWDLVIIASIIEREARVPGDQAKVSRVIHNRLAQGMALEVDATLLYGIGHKEVLTQSDLETDTPYNTRLYPGLPPGPIAMPGRSALDAAINPEPGPWLFYVLASEDGSHFFTDNFDEFLRVAQEAREAGIFE
jgi:UPF0755 protein